MGKGGKKPEELAREKIDLALDKAGWIVQDLEEMNIYAGQGVAVREYKLKSGHGRADYLLFVDQRPVGVLEAKPAGHPLIGVEPQTDKYAAGLPDNLDPPVAPLPFLYMSTGVKTGFYNLLDPKHRTREIYRIHRPETLAEWLEADTLDEWVKSLHGEGSGFYTAADDTKPSTLRSRVQTLPPVEIPNLWQNKVTAVTNLEQSLKLDKPKALIQMATGSGKTLLAITQIYRLIKFGGARRVLFLVDRSNLGEQAEKEFTGYRTPDDNRKFDELYKVQRLTTNTIGASTKVVITTIQRLYSMLRGDPEFDPEHEDVSAFEEDDTGIKAPLPVVYNPAYPPEFFDVIIVDECHRSIYSLWQQVLEYFDAYIIGLTATPAKHTFGFFNQNLVMEYPHEKAVADGVNVDFELYKIRTQITESGSKIDAGEVPLVKYRNRATREERWEKPDEDIEYEGKDLDKNVVATDQIRLIVQTYRDRLFTEIFPGREIVPKTLVFAKDDSHAEDIVKIIREEFGRGNEFCQKITYKVTGQKPSDLITDFRNAYNPRIAVTVDMVATGTDIKPIEVVMFMRAVKSRVLFEQMKGRGVRIIDDNELQAVTADAHSKTHFVIVDCVGITETDMADTHPLERKKSISFKALLEHVKGGGTDPSMLSSLAGRLARLDKQCGPDEHAKIEAASGGVTLTTIVNDIVAALDADNQIQRARDTNDLGPEEKPTEEQIEQARRELLKEAGKILASKPELRKTLREVKTSLEQILDIVSKDALLFAGASDEAKEKAKSVVGSFREFIEENKDEITALQFFYSTPHRRRLQFKDIKELANAVQAPPRSWTPEKLWRAYELLEADRVRGASGKRLLTDLVSLVRFTLDEDDELAPFAEQVQERFDNWLAQQQNTGKDFTPEQRHWLEMIRDHIATSLEVDIDDFDYAPFAEEGGLGKARQVFGKELKQVLNELNEVLAA